MFSAEVVPMADRKYQLVPLDRIRVLNSRNRDETQFSENVQSINDVGLLKPIVVNERPLRKEGFFELVCGEGRYLAFKRLGRERIPAEVINCDRKTALLFSLVENIARVPPDTMWFAREMKRMKDCGMNGRKIGQIVGKSETYVGEYIRLVEMGEERLIKGVEQGLFSMALALSIAKSDSAAVQNVLMDAFDKGLISSANATRVRKLIETRLRRGRKAPGKNGKKGGERPYTVRELKTDIARVTHQKEGFVQQASARETRLLLLLDGLETVFAHEPSVELLREEGLVERPELVGTYTM